MRNCEICKQLLKPEDLLTVVVRKDGGRSLYGAEIHRRCVNDRMVVKLPGGYPMIAMNIGFIRRSR